ANTIELTQRLDQELDRLQQELPKGMTIDRLIFRQANFIEVAVVNVISALRDGGILVVLVVVLFLANFRAAAITLTAMPLSLAAAILVLRAFGATINTMTLGGMAIAIGALSTTPSSTSRTWSVVSGRTMRRRRNGSSQPAMWCVT